MDAGEVAEQVRVPALVGLLVDDARVVASANDLLLTTANLDGPSLGSLAFPWEWTVIGQAPEAGVLVERCSWVVVELMNFGGGDAGDREPRLPAPPADALAVRCDLPGLVPDPQRGAPQG
ncbi:MAG: hypothetical protein M0004_11210 [Actinomycetota bacterium]|nr:hypothetical protein [Actinomycetota bacterium]